MAIEIVEVDLTEMRRTALLSRAKSPNVRALYEAMFSLEPGGARAVIAEPGEELSQIRNLVTQCAARADMNLQIVVDRIGGRVLFTHKPQDSIDDETTPSRPSVSRSPEEQAAQIDRREKIRAAALALGRERPQISAQEVVDYLRHSGDELDLPRPTTAVSAVMRNMPEFEHIDRSRFSYRG
ncbi:MAG: hypothetical protein OXC83_09265 [Chloroflexi bacterium]|nr:hypothetical protein [Chloroflexota bacterium]